MEEEEDKKKKNEVRSRKKVSDEKVDRVGKEESGGSGRVREEKGMKEKRDYTKGTRRDLKTARGKEERKKEK